MYLLDIVTRTRLKQKIFLILYFSSDNMKGLIYSTYFNSRLVHICVVYVTVYPRTFIFGIFYVMGTY